MIEFKMPSLGADMETGTLVKWNVKPGDTVKRGDIIAEVDTQKGLIEIEVFDTGVIDKLIVKENEKVPVGIVMALIKSDSEKVTTEKITPMKQGTEIATPGIEIKEEKAISVRDTAETKRHIKISPLAKKIAEENHVDWSSLTGSGEEGAIVKEDIEKVISAKQSGVKSQTGSTAESIRMAVAAAMSKSNREIPHYYLETQIDMSKSMAWLKEQNKNRPVEKRLLSAALLIKAVSKAVQDVPDLNAYWENGPVLKKEVNVGFIVSLRSGGLMVPAILNTESKSIDEIMATLNDIIPRARELKLRSSEIAGSTITITNIGEGGVEKVFGVIYPPQVAIIGFGSVSEQPFAENGKVEVRAVMTATLAGDHRATDGNTGSKFLLALKKHLQNPETL